MDYEIYNKHYAQVDEKGRITYIWSDGPCPNEPTDGAVCINDKGSYQVYLTVDGVRTQENPMIWDDYGIPLYKWDGEAIRRRTEAEIEADREAIPPPPPSPLEQLRADVDFIAVMQGVEL